MKFDLFLQFMNKILFERWCTSDEDHENSCE